MRRKGLNRKRRKERRERRMLEKGRPERPALDEETRTEARTIAPDDVILGG